jgi:hypothetical protein
MSAIQAARAQGAGYSVTVADAVVCKSRSRFRQLVVGGYIAGPGRGTGV